METSEHGTKLKDRLVNDKVTDHDILIELYNDVGWIKKLMGNHLKHHWAITLAATGAAISALIALIISWTS